jgi:hypothetical protein
MRSYLRWVAILVVSLTVGLASLANSQWPLMGDIYLRGAILEKLGAEEVLERPIILELEVLIFDYMGCHYKLSGEPSRDDERRVITLEAEVVPPAGPIVVCGPVDAPSSAYGSWSLGAIGINYKLLSRIFSGSGPLLRPFEISSVYDLQVDEEKLLLRYQSGHSIDFGAIELRRIPKGLIWTSLQTKEESLRHGFLQDLKARGASEVCLPAGVYATDLISFDVDNQCIARIAGMIAGIRVLGERLWTLTYAGETADLEVLIRTWDSLFCKRIAINLWTWKGEHFGFKKC